MRAKTLTPDQIERLVAKAKPMQRAMVLLMFRAGLRSQEVAALTWPMVLDAEGSIASFIDLPAIATKGKTGAGRVPMTEDLREALKVFWLRRRMPRAGAVICDQDGNHLTANAIRFRLKTIVKKAGLEGVTSHSGRRTVGTTLAGNPSLTLSSVQAVLRHARPSTTLTYIDAASNKAIVEAMEAMAK